MIYEILEYPVSGVMKFWHFFLVRLGADPVSSWIACLFLLVLSIRSILIPFVYTQYKSTRIQINLRPTIRAIRQEYKDKPGMEARKERMQKEKQARQEAGYSMSAGCFTALIQVPFFLGLYRVLLNMARPQDGLDTKTHASIGFLSGTDVSEFLDARVFGVPLPAYAAMSAQRLHQMGTDKATIFTLAIPLVIFAASFTSINMAYSIYRNKNQLEHESAIAVFTHNLLVPMSFFASLSPLLFGLITPVPVAILMYWVANNLWTMTQNIFLYRLIDKRHPYSDEFLEMFQETKVIHDQRMREKKEAKRTRRRNKWRRRFIGLTRPWRIPEMYSEAREEKRLRKEEKHQAKLERRQARKARTEADREADRLARERKAAESEGGAAASSQVSSEDALSAKSPDEEAAESSGDASGSDSAPQKPSSVTVFPDRILESRGSTPITSTGYDWHKKREENLERDYVGRHRRREE